MHDLAVEVCQREEIAFDQIRPMQGGQINQLFQIDDRFVVRIGRNQDAHTRFQREENLNNLLGSDIPYPRILHSGTIGDFPYQIQALAAGEQLHRVWTQFTPAQQQSLIVELSGYMRQIHQHRFEHFGPYQDPRDTNWHSYIKGWFDWSFGLATTGPKPLPSHVLELIAAHFDEHQDCLHGGTPTLIHSDLWFGNILVADGKISALLDFEFTKQTAVDYELTQIEHFCLYPNSYADEEDEIYCTSDFAAIMPLLRNMYPTLFDVPRLRERVDIYQLIYCMDIHNSMQHDHQYDEGIQFITAKLYNFLIDNGVRAFL